MARDAALAWLIWSDEDAAWRTPATPGSSRRIGAAGRYSLPEALEICGRAETPVMTPEMTATVLRAFADITRQLDMTSVHISDPECRAVTDRKIAEARAALAAAGVEE